MPLWTVDSGGLKEACVTRKAQRRLPANMIERSVCGGGAALYQTRMWGPYSSLATITLGIGPHF